MLERLLAGVSEQRARIAILDVTGVPFVDTEVVDWLVRASAATSLLGAQCVLVGISPEVAQALVASSANLNRLITRANLRSAVEYAMRKLNGRSVLSGIVLEAENQGSKIDGFRSPILDLRCSATPSSEAR